MIRVSRREGCALLCRTTPLSLRNHTFPCMKSPLRGRCDLPEPAGRLFVVLAAALAMLFAPGQARSQNVLLENDYMNPVRQPDHSGALDNVAVPAPPPGPNPGLRMNASTFGGWVSHRLSVSGQVAAGDRNATPGPVAAGDFLYPGNGVIRLENAQLGVHLRSRRTTYGIGDVIAPPTRRLDGTEVPEGFFLAEPAHDAALSTPEYDPVTGELLPAVTNPTGGDQFYWSPHAQKVFATQPGNIRIKWRLAEDPGQYEEHVYLVSFASKVPVRKIYWTENGFNGPRVVIPRSRVNEVNIVYNSYFPKTVPDTETYPAPRGQTLVAKADRVRTLWLNQPGTQDGILQAYNREGRVFVEYLGPLAGDPRFPDRRIHLGFDIVEVARETSPLPKEMWVGDRATPVDQPDLDESALQPSLLTELGVTEPFFYRHVPPSGNGLDLYAIRTTTPTFIEGVEVPSNEATIYWMEKGIFDIQWPRQYATYVIRWPSEVTDEDAYSVFARPSTGGTADNLATAVSIPSENLPQLVFQDDPESEHAFLTSDKRFYTAGNGRSLILHQQGGNIWFERILSRVDSDFPSYAIQNTVAVGSRIEPPAGADDLPGHIRPEGGRAYNAAAYVDPLTAGFEEAAKGAIIGVNALSASGAPDTGKDSLEVWWFRTNQPPAGSGIKPVYWPSHVARYRLVWPDDASEIVLASNLGSGELPSLQARGSIYVQNDPNLPGYNPNEEHALISGGVVWALRDDLNLPTSSEPYALLDYTEADERPAMRVFRVIREKDPWFFDYPATAGTILQAPMPLPVLPLPRDDSGRVIHEEVDSDPDEPANEQEKANSIYAGFTFQDRKGSTWIHRGPHADGAPSFGMQFYYQVQPGFHFPGLAADAQPAPGTNVPYLRPYADPDDPDEGYAGHPVTGTPLTVVFRPVWPVTVPRLELGRTLTMAADGLPQIRGNTSLEILYQQSIANQLAPDEDDYAPLQSAILHDPTRAKTYVFPDPAGNDGGSATGSSLLNRIPASIETSDYLGKTYFPNLAPHLSRRFYFDPNVGPAGALVLIGEFVDEVTGVDYVLPNVLSPGDLQNIIGLCASDDDDFARWKAAIESLSTGLELFVEDPARPNTYIVDQTVTYTATEPVVVTDDDQAVDSYALTATGGGTGYVVLIAGNGEAFTPEGEPVSMLIVQVENPLYRAELKPVPPANPLDERFTLQFANDFAGNPFDYEFEWRYGRPVDGLPPALYQFQRILAMGDAAWTLINEPPANPAPLRAPGANLAGLNAVTIAPGAAFEIRSESEDASSEGSPPLAILRREFTYSRPPGSADARLFLSVSLTGSELTPPPSGFIAWLNGQRVVTWGVPGEESNPVGAAPGGDFNPLPLIFGLNPSALNSGTNVLVLELFTTAEPGTIAQVNARVESEVLIPDLSGWLPLGAEPGESLSDLGGIQGKNRHTVGGPGLLTLTDNYYIVRYRALNDTHAAWEDGGGWSAWTEPQLVEGWIKRVLAGINPFQQRIRDLYNNAVNTDVSLVAQAGRRWEGDIALNLENVNATGLIEIYETVLRRGKMLSIEATPPLSDPGANDALLLAAGYLNDLYMILHNEAYADAADPTIAFGTDSGEYGTAVTSLFAFRGQVPSVLEEELALLRGRDDFLQPGTRTAPYYNRLVWNYTRGIDAGEAVYALNYNIKDLNQDGVVGPEDAARAYPQGHGDAWGHALTALSGYYGLLRNPYFSWSPRIEAVTVLGKAVSVDYQDERKFAGAAAALARTASQVLDLTYRKEFVPGSVPTWTHLKDERFNSSTGITRRWGTDDWASRAGQGAYFHWVTGNSFLPSVDPDPTHEGIQKVDRTTVPELVALVNHANSIQRTSDTADARLNPLGLSNSALPFDVDPNFLEVGSTIQGKMYFPQILDRALSALQNAADAFQRAGTVTEMLRRQGDSLDEQIAAINEQERAFEAALVDIYGTPYPDDIGPGRTWAQGYAGPDLIHYAYVDQVERFASPPDEGTEDNGVTEIKFRASAAFVDETSNIDFEPELTDPEESITIRIGPRGEMVKPGTWTGRRAHPGRMQTAYSDWITARRELIEAAEDCEYAALVVDRQMKLYESAVDAHDKKLAHDINNATAFGVLTPVKIGLEAGARYIELSKEFAKDTAEATADGAPTSVGMSVDPGFPARLIAKLTSAVSGLGFKAAINGLEIGAKTIEFGLELANKVSEIEKQKIDFVHENRQMLHELRQAVEDCVTQQRALDAALRRFDQAERDLQTLQAEGLRIRAERQIFRQRAAAIIHGYRTKDFAFRAFRNEALESYKLLFDHAARAAYLAARAYDYETGLLDPDRSPAAADFFNGIIQARALGMISEAGIPQFGGSDTGDPGLAGLLAKLRADWGVVESRLGFNNPDRYSTTFSLRTENFRILPGTEGDSAWRTVLDSARMENVLDDEDVRRYCMQIDDGSGLPVPGFVIPFSTTVQTGTNFFGRPLAGGDNTFSPSSFATKIRASGIAFRGYPGMQSPTSISGAAGDAGGESPEDPWTGFTDPSALSATPYVYLIPVGLDFMRAPALGDSGAVRNWSVEDQAMPLPFNIGQTSNSVQTPLQSALSLTESPFILRKHQAFRAIPDGVPFSEDPGFTNGRLIGRSVWNSRWKIVIPGNTLLADPARATRIFADTVKDIKLHFQTYSYSGN